MNFFSNESLLFFEKLEKTQIIRLSNKNVDLKQLTDDSISNGDIYIFQIDEGVELFTNYKLAYVEDYLNFIMD